MCCICLATGGASLLDRAMGIASDDGNFIYVVGSFRGTANFGSQVVQSSEVSDGVYFVRMQTRGGTMTETLILTK